MLLSLSISFYLIFFKLFLVAKRKSLFNDKPKEIQELTYIIKQVGCLYNIFYWDFFKNFTLNHNLRMLNIIFIVLFSFLLGHKSSQSTNWRFTTGYN